MPQRIIEQRLFGLGGRVLGIERLELPLPQALPRPGCPRRRPRRQKRLADGARLFLLALQFELAGLLRPFVLAGGGPRGRRHFLSLLQVEQPKKRVLNVGLGDGEPNDRAGHGHVKRVDVELVEFERLVSLVLSAAVIEVGAFEIACCDITAYFGVSGAVGRNHLEQDNVRILETLGLVD